MIKKFKKESHKEPTFKGISGNSIDQIRELH